MLRLTKLSIFTALGRSVILLLLVGMANPQSNPHYPIPPAPLDPSARQESSTQHAHRTDPLQLQRDADELARIAQTIPADIASVRQGMLPKDVNEKLKQVEKLSKRLRTELMP
jgi:hypothetical protein